MNGTKNISFFGTPGMSCWHPETRFVCAAMGVRRINDVVTTCPIPFTYYAVIKQKQPTDGMVSLSGMGDFDFGFCPTEFSWDDISSRSPRRHLRLSHLGSHYIGWVSVVPQKFQSVIDTSDFVRENLSFLTRVTEATLTVQYNTIESNRDIRSVFSIGASDFAVGVFARHSRQKRNSALARATEVPQPRFYLLLSLIDLFP
eukprot:scaffold34609_cov146-Amphora_coffeaeformis.AAC.16